MDYETLQMRLCLPDGRKCTIKWQEKGSGLLTLPVRPGRASLAISGKLGGSSLDIQSLTDTATGEEVVVPREVIFEEWKERRRETGACGKKLWAGCVQKETQARQSVESLGEGIKMDEAFVGSQRRRTKRVTFRETVSGRFLDKETGRLKGWPFKTELKEHATKTKEWKKRRAKHPSALNISTSGHSLDEGGVRRSPRLAEKERASQEPPPRPCSHSSSSSSRQVDHCDPSFADDPSLTPADRIEDERGGKSLMEPRESLQQVQKDSLQSDSSEIEKAERQSENEQMEGKKRERWKEKEEKRRKKKEKKAKASAAGSRVENGRVCRDHGCNPGEGGGTRSGTDSRDDAPVSETGGPGCSRKRERMRVEGKELEELVQRAHREMGHLGGAALSRSLSKYIKGSRLREVCRKTMEGCKECAQVKGAPHRWRGWTARLRRGRPLKRIAVDLHFVKGTPIVIIIDECTRWLVAVPVEGEDVATVWKAVRDHWIMPFGYPVGLRSCFRTDNG
eukprot:Cvel_36090.t1-p1 / transcript=Cvel_36090.t1 / gene=Cvel_36090 / organism=Chromera_velia_CCMP2878 / gene_product=hypothetical protein / transcript_product=hypothetical protein / location=Cvel_scaffold6929:8-1526(-) / protein_length=506 / sequence_SO=supercontig / SO=protein_coding / is_pseudo=false